MDFYGVLLALALVGSLAAGYLGIPLGAYLIGLVAFLSVVGLAFGGNR